MSQTGAAPASSKISLASRLAGGIWGHLVGDAVGVPYEFLAADRIEKVIFGAPNGMWHQPPGTWSDDGALMLALLDSLLGKAPKGPTRFDPEDQGRRALAWDRDKAYTPDAEGRFDIGNATASALGALALGTPAIDAGRTDEHASSNGSLMRILPLALVERSVDERTLIDHAHLASRVTHGHPRCQVACALYVLIGRRLLEGHERTEALTTARETLRTHYASSEDLAPHAAALDELKAHTDRSGRGYVLDAFWSAWDAFAGADDYRTTIERAVRYGNDTDTTAAIAGGLAGIRWGWEGIPLEWRRGMRGKKQADPLVDRLVATTGARTSTLRPLRSDQIDLDGTAVAEVSGARLGITFLPGKKRDGHTGPQWRDLDTDVANLEELSVNALLLLVEDPELDWCLVPELPDVVSASSIELIRFPIRDPRTPTDEAAFRAMLGGLIERLQAGQFVTIACRGGVDRSGLAAACLLIRLGLDTQTAIDRVHAGRHGSLTLPDQLAYVEAWRT